MPASTEEPLAICPAATCPKTPEQPTYPYPTPALKFTGRFVDSTLTRDYQTPIRTYRARGARVAKEHNRVYMMMGSTLAGYRLDTFFSSQLGSPLASVGAYREGLPPEQYLPFQMSVYPERVGSGWVTPVRDGQDRLADFDWDDRGYIGAAYSIFGWGLVDSSGVLKVQITNPPSGAANIGLFKDAAKYYALLSSGGSSSTLYDITNPTAPVQRPLLAYGAKLIEKLADARGDVLALIDNSNNLRIYEANALVTGGAPQLTLAINRPTSLSTDGVRFFLTSGLGTAYLHVFTPENGRWVQTTLPLAPTLHTALYVNAIPGYVSVSGNSTEGPRTRFSRLTRDDTLTEVEGSAFFERYYTYKSSGYAVPDGYMSSTMGVVPTVSDGRTYLINSHHGLGDVYEVDVPLVAEPRFTSPVEYAIREGETLNVQLGATSSNPSPAIRFLYIGAPQGFSLTTSGALKWTPTGPERSETFRVFLLDDSGGFSYQDVTLHLLAASSEHMTLDGVSASNVPAAGASITVTGNSFSPLARVFIGGAAATIHAVSSTTAAVTTPGLPAGALHDVILRNPDGTFGVLDDAIFTNFNDVPAGDLFRSSVESLVRAAVTSGCGGGNFCPSTPTTRGEMAVFLLRAKHGAAYLPPAPTGSVFNDVPATDLFARWIEQLAREGITSGCGGGSYCSSAEVTREQMAVFLLLAREGGAYAPPPAQGIFTDVAVSNPFSSWIEELSRRGITAGCGNATTYCPAASVTRGQMAAFLKSTFGMP